MCSSVCIVVRALDDFDAILSCGFFDAAATFIHQTPCSSASIASPGARDDGHDVVGESDENEAVADASPVDLERDVAESIGVFFLSLVTNTFAVGSDDDKNGAVICCPPPPPDHAPPYDPRNFICLFAFFFSSTPTTTELLRVIFDALLTSGLVNELLDKCSTAFVPFKLRVRALNFLRPSAILYSY